MNKKQMQELINKLSICPIWECYTRAALECWWDEFQKDTTGIVYLDIDDMHGLNYKYTHSGVDEKIKGVIHNVRHNDVVASRWLNGDELIFILRSGSPENFAHRLQDEFKAVGINATFCHSQIIQGTAQETINPLDEIVQASKNDNKKGIILKGA